MPILKIFIFNQFNIYKIKFYNFIKLPFQLIRFYDIKVDPEKK